MSLSALQGPVDGMLEVPITVHWGPTRIFDLSEARQRRMVYQALVREGTSQIQEALHSCALATMVVSAGIDAWGTTARTSEGSDNLNPRRKRFALRAGNGRRHWPAVLATRGNVPELREDQACGVRSRPPW